MDEWEVIPLAGCEEFVGEFRRVVEESEAAILGSLLIPAMVMAPWWLSGASDGLSLAGFGEGDSGDSARGRS